MIKYAYIGKTWKNLPVWNQKSYSLDTWHVASPSKILPISFKVCPWGQKWPRRRGHVGLYKKWNEAYNSMLNIFPLHTSLTPGVGSRGQFVFYSESSHVACQIYGNEAENAMQASIMPYYTPTTPRWGQKVKTFFWRSCCIKGKEVKSIRQIDVMYRPESQALKLCR